jgi:hypothetical protein
MGGNAEYLAIHQEPQIGIEIAGYPKSLSPSKKWNTIYQVEFSGIKYSVTVNPKQLIVRIITGDSAFKTSEGIAIGDSVEKVLAFAKSPLAQRECAQTIRLGSGWDAYFDVLPDGRLIPDARVVTFGKARAIPAATTKN